MFRRLPKSLCIPIAVLLLSLLAGSVSAQNRGTFVGAVNYPAGAPTVPSNTGFLGGGVQPLDAKVGDVNGDGKPDVIIAAACGSPITGYGIPGCPSSGYAVVVYLGNGDGTFQPPIFSGSIPQLTRSIAVGDFNNDAKLDVAVVSDCDSVDCTQGSVSILLGAGDGTFTQASQYTFDGAVLTAETAAVGDFNNDGKLDLAVGIGCFNLSVTGCTNGAVSIYWGNGDGTLSSPTSYPAPGNTANYLVVGDFNGDGKLDIIAGSGNSGSSALTILLGNGSGTFAESTLALPFGLSSLAAADFNGDGKLDLAIVSSSGVQTLFGNGDGTFQSPVQAQANLAFPVYYPFAILAVDVNGDGKPDLLVSGAVAGYGIGVWLNDGTGNFTATQSYPMGGWQNAPILAADFNGDGKVDVVMAAECSESTTPGNHCPDGSIDVLLGNGDGTFQGPVLMTSPAGSGVFLVGAADFNGDGIPDLFVSDACVPGSSPQVCGAAVLLGKPNATYQPPTVAQSGAQVPEFSLSADFNRDGKADLAVLNACDSLTTCAQSSVSISLGNGDGTFQAAVTYPIGGMTPVGIVTGDFNGDGILDLAAATQCSDSSCSTGAVSILLGNGDGTLQPAVTTTIGTGVLAYSLAAADFNHDGRTDLVVGGNPNLAVILLSNGGATLSIAGTYSTGGGGAVFVPATGDLNHDGNTDVVFANVCEPTSGDTSCSNGSIGVLLGNGDGTFRPVQETVVADGNLISANLTDVDGDGNLDLVSSTTGGVIVARGKGDGTFQTPVIYGGLWDSAQQMVLAVTDLNNDGAPDIVKADSAGNLGIFYNRGGTFITAGTSASPANAGQSITFSATVAGSIQKNVTATGSVTFYDNTTALGTISLAGGAASLTISTLSVGTHTITVAYSGDTNFNPHAAAPFTQVVVNAIAPTTTTLTSSVNPAQLGQSVTFTATVSGGTSPTGSVTFNDGSTLLATVALTGNQASYSTSSLAAGNHSITAPYSGDTANSASTSATLYQSIISVQSGATLYGVVTDRTTGRPLPGVAVKLCNSQCGQALPQYLTSTDANGNYALTGSQLGVTSGTLVFQLQGYWSNPQTFTISTVPTQLNASLLPGGAVIQGTVTDTSTQQGIVGATVQFMTSSRNLIVEDAGPFVIMTQSGPGGAYTMDSSHFMEGATAGISLQNASGYAYVSAAGYLTMTPASSNITPPYPVIQNFSLIPQGSENSVTVATSPTGLAVMIDGTTYTAPPAFLWPTGSIHTLAVSSPQGGSGTQNVFAQWSDSSAQSHQVTISGAATYTATFNTQYQLTTAANPTSGGTITAGGYFNAGSSVTITATPNSGYTFTGFSGDLTGTTNPQTLVMNAPKNVTASFALPVPTTTVISSSVNPVIFGQSVTFTATVSGGTSPTGSVTFNDGATVLATVALTGNQAVFATTSLAVGSHPIVAIYSGDTSNSSSTSPILYESVTTLQTGAVVYGTVTDRSTGLPLAGVSITNCTQCQKGAAAATTTDASGNYSLTAAQLGNTFGSLNFQMLGYFVNVATYKYGTTPTIVDVTLLPGGTVLQGVVTDGSTQAGIAGVSLTIMPSGGQGFPNVGAVSAATASNGQYAIDSSNFYEKAAIGFTGTVQLSATGYFSSSAPFSAPTPFPAIQNFSMLSDSGTVLQGTVTDRSTGLPIAGATVTNCTICKGTGSVTTDSNGNYTLTGAQLSGSATGVLYFQALGYYVNSSNYSITAIPTTLNTTLLPGGTVLQGTVTDLNTLAGIAGASLLMQIQVTQGQGQGPVFPSGNSLTVTTTAGGQYTVDSSNFFETGAAGFSVSSVQLSATGYFNTTAAGFAVAAPIPVTQNFTMIADSGVVLQGTVSDRSTGLPIAGVSVTNCAICKGPAPAITDANGNYSLTGPELNNSSSGILYFQAQGYYVNTASFSITVSPTNLNVTLLPGGTVLQGTVTDASTQAGIVSASVLIAPLTAQGQQALAFPNGVVSLTTGSGGQYTADSSNFYEAAAAGFTVSQVKLFATGYNPGFFGSFPVATPFPVTQNFTMSSTGALVSVTVATNPAGLGIIVDGNSYTAPQTFQWQPSNAHTIATISPQAATSPGTQYGFSAWSDGGPLSHMIVAPGTNTTYTATFTTQYLLTTTANPSADGIITVGGYFNAGSSVTVTATPNSGFTFTGFSGDLTGTTNPQTLVMDAPKTVTASFAPSIVSTTTSITAPAVSYGTAASVTVSVAAAQGTATGNVSLTVDNGAPLTQALSNGSTTFSISGLAVGSHNLSASFAAQGNFGASSATGTLQVNQATTTVSVSNIPSSAVFGGSFTVAYAYTGDGTPSVTSSTSATCAVSGNIVNFVGAGTCTLMAQATAGTNYAAVTGSPQSFTIGQATPTISISNIPNNAVYGGNFTATYTYTGNGTTSVTSSTTTTCTVSGNVVNFVGAGTCTLTAHATATTNYAAATGSPQSFTIAQATTTVSINDIPGNAVFGGNFTATYSYIGDGTPSVTSSTATCTVSGNLVRFVAAGTCTLTARATAGTNYAAATGAPQSFTIAQATTTISLNNIPTAAVFGSGFTATYSYIGDGIPSVTSSTPATCAASGSAVSFVGTGTCTLTARATAGTNYAATTGSPQSFTIAQATTTTTVSSSQNPQIVNQPITFKATVASQFGAAATGSVVFKNGATTLGTASLSGNQAIFTTSFSTTGTRSITAQYTGDGNNLGSASSALSQSVVAKFATTTTLVSSLNPSFVGQLVTFTATVTSAGGAPPNGEVITFKQGTTTLATAPLSGGSASFTTSALAAGSHTITASYGGDATFAASTSSGLKQVVNKYPTSTSLASSLNQSTFGQSVTFTATVTSAGPSTPTGNVTFRNGSTTLATVALNASGVATLTRSNLAAGTLSITATYNGDTQSATSSASLSQVINMAVTSTTVTSSRNPSTFGQSVTFTATVTSPTTTPTGTVTFTSGSTTLGTVTLSSGKASLSTKTLPRGANSITATYNGTANITGSSASLTQQVN